MAAKKPPTPPGPSLEEVTQERDQARQTIVQLQQELNLADQLNGGLQRSNARLTAALNQVLASPPSEGLTVVEGEKVDG